MRRKRTGRRWSRTDGSPRSSVACSKCPGNKNKLFHYLDIHLIVKFQSHFFL
jgi:hypothetical protein